MGLTVKTILLIYLGIFVTAVVVAVGVNIALVTLPISNEAAYANMTKFATSMTDILEVAFGALIGALSASLQRVISKEDNISTKSAKSIHKEAG